MEVLGLIPAFPGARLFARWWKVGRLAAAPRFETIAGLPVHHPRMLFVPRVPSLGPPLVMAALLREIASRRARTDVIVRSCAYPEGVACIWLGRLLGIPTALQTLGSDLNVTPNLWGPRQWLSRTLPHAGRVLAVSRPLADRAIELGAAPERTLVIPNGVDKTRFFRAIPSPAGASSVSPRTDAGSSTWASCTRARASSTSWMRSNASPPTCPTRSWRWWVRDQNWAACRRSRTSSPAGWSQPAAVPHNQVALFMGAADICTLPSWREGTPNVVIEALASGRRVVATRVGGIPDVIRKPEQGELVEARDIPALAGALTRALGTPADSRALAAESPELVRQRTPAARHARDAGARSARSGGTP